MACKSCWLSEISLGSDHGDYFVLGTQFNPTLSPRYIRGKMYYQYGVRLSKDEANLLAKGERDRGKRAVVIPLTLWMRRIGYELGNDKVPAFVVFSAFKHEMKGR